MNNYSLYDMLGLIKLGVWSGGEVDVLGYVGRAVRCEDIESDGGVSCLYYLSYDVIVLKSSSGADGEIKLTLGLYQPYERCLSRYTLNVNAVSEIELRKRLTNLVEGGQKSLVWSHNIYKKNPFHHESKYKAVYGSVRGGSIGTTRRNR